MTVGTPGAPSCSPPWASRSPTRSLKPSSEVTGREQAPTEPCEELIGIIGRRGGKSRAEAVQATYLATLIDYSDVLAPGERGLVLCIAPDLKQASIVHSYIAANIDQSPALQAAARKLDPNHASAHQRHRHRGALGIVPPTARRHLRCRYCRRVVFLVQRRNQRQPRQRNLASGATDPADHAWAAHPHQHALQHDVARLGKRFSRDYGPQGDPSVLVATGVRAPSIPA